MKSNAEIAKDLVGAKEPDGDEAGDDGSDAGLEDAVRRYFEAGKAGRYAEAASAFRDAMAIGQAPGGDNDGDEY